MCRLYVSAVLMAYNISLEVGSLFNTLFQSESQNQLKSHYMAQKLEGTRGGEIR